MKPGIIPLGVLGLAVAGVTGCSAAGPHVDRAGVVTMRGKPVTLEGRTPRVGEAAPGFGGVANDMSTFRFDPRAEGAGGKVWILASVPSLDTPVCSTETRRFNEEASRLGPDVRIVTVSMDLPFAQKRWCGAEGVQRLETVSDFKDRSFARAYGLRVTETGLLARAVFVVGRDGRIVYEQIVPELAREPDYAAALDAARKAETGKSR